MMSIPLPQVPYRASPKHIREIVLRYLLLVGLVASLLTACSAGRSRTDLPVSQVLFVCKHGNVKSLMAASYFNELAAARDLPYRAVSRGSAPDSDTVPREIVVALRADGFDVSGFRPAAVTAAEVASSAHVVLIGTALPVTASGPAPETDTWEHIPPASTNYAAARDALKGHVTELVDELEQGYR